MSSSDTLALLLRSTKILLFMSGWCMVRGCSGGDGEIVKRTPMMVMTLANEYQRCKNRDKRMSTIPNAVRMLSEVTESLECTYTTTHNTRGPGKNIRRR